MLLALLAVSATVSAAEAPKAAVKADANKGAKPLIDAARGIVPVMAMAIRPKSI